jgi:hypothetical protein
MSVKQIHRPNHKTKEFQELTMFFRVWYQPQFKRELPLACKLASAFRRNGWETSVMCYNDDKPLIVTIRRKKK